MTSSLWFNNNNNNFDSPYFSGTVAVLHDNWGLLSTWNSAFTGLKVAGAHNSCRNHSQFILWGICKLINTHTHTHTTHTTHIPKAVLILRIWADFWRKTYIAYSCEYRSDRRACFQQVSNKSAWSYQYDVVNTYLFALWLGSISLFILIRLSEWCQREQKILFSTEYPLA